MLRTELEPTLLMHVSVDDPALPDTRIRDLKIAARAARGETISLSFELETDCDLANVQLQCKPFEKDGQLREKVQADLYIVHIWKQAGLGVYQSEETLVKELLLKDDRVRIEDRYSRKFRHWKHLFRPHFEYQAPDLRLSGDVCTQLKKKQPKCFFLIIKTNSEEAPGSYRSAIQVSSDKGELGIPIIIDIELEILPFALEQPRQDLFMWFRGKLDWRDPQHYLSEDMYRSHLRAIKEHGFTSISISEIDKEHTQRAIEIAEEVGFSRNLVLMPPFPADPDKLKYTKVNPIVYVSDEIDIHIAHPDAIGVAGETLIEHHKMNWRRAQKWKFQSFCSLVHSSFGQRFFDSADLGHAPSTIGYFLASNRDFFHLGAHVAEARIVPTYYYWQSYQEKPNLNRVLAGVYLWKSRADGIAPYCFQHMPERPFSPYDDFDQWIPDFHVGPVRRPFKDHMTTYPARTGIIPTLQWEGLRDGITDLRYLTTLDNLLQNSPQHRDSAEIRIGIDRFLKRIDLRSISINHEQEPEPYIDIHPSEYVEFREKMRDWILRLRQTQ